MFFCSKKTLAAAVDAAVTKALNDREVCEMPYRVCQQVYARTGNIDDARMVAASLEKAFNKTA